MGGDFNSLCSCCVQSDQLIELGTVTTASNKYVVIYFVAQELKNFFLKLPFAFAVTLFGKETGKMEKKEGQTKLTNRI